MLIRLIYVSKAVDPQTGTLAESILRKAHLWNTQNDITGVLCEGQGVFLQALEGERGRVTHLYALIAADSFFRPGSGLLFRFSGCGRHHVCVV